MKKILLFLLILVSFTTVAANKKQISKPKKPLIVCFGWRDINSPTEPGEVVGKTSSRCWTAELGWHSVTILYKY